MPRKQLYHCSFCGKKPRDVKKLIAGPVKEAETGQSVTICDECVQLCVEILLEEMEKIVVEKKEETVAKSVKGILFVCFSRRKSFRVTKYSNESVEFRPGVILGHGQVAGIDDSTGKPIEVDIDDIKEVTIL